MAALDDRRDESIAWALARGLSARQTAKEAGCSDRTVRNRMRQPEVAARIHEIRDEMLAEAIGKLSAVAGQAVDALAKLLGSTNEFVILQATQQVLGNVVRLREFAELASRVERLEQAARSQQLEAVQ